MPIEEARKPGSSDLRNETMLKIFSFVNIGERAGSGMGTIENGWTAAGYPAPSYEVAYGPDRTTLTLPLVSADSTGEGQSKTIEGRRRRAKKLFRRRRVRSLNSSESLGRRGLLRWLSVSARARHAPMSCCADLLNRGW